MLYGGTLNRKCPDTPQRKRISDWLNSIILLVTCIISDVSDVSCAIQNLNKEVSLHSRRY